MSLKLVNPRDVAGKAEEVSRLLHVPATCTVGFSEGSAQTVVRATTLRMNLQMKLAVSPSYTELTQGQPVLAPA